MGTDGSTILTWDAAFASGDAVEVQAHRLDSAVAPHGHEFVEIVLVLGGEGTHRTQEGDRTLRRGEALRLRPGAWHSYVDCRRLDLINVAFAPSLVRHELRPLLGHAERGFLRRGDPIVVATPDEVRWTRAEAASRGAQAAGPLGRLGALLTVLEAVAPPMALPTRTPDYAARAIDALEAEIERPWRLAELADLVGVAEGTLVRAVRRTLGRAPMAYLTMLRMERAAGLLRRTDLPVGEIGARVGYSDPNLFARRFRTVHGRPPSEYRESGLPIPGGIRGAA